MTIDVQEIRDAAADGQPALDAARAALAGRLRVQELARGLPAKLTAARAARVEARAAMDRFEAARAIADGLAIMNGEATETGGPATDAEVRAAWNIACVNVAKLEAVERAIPVALREADDAIDAAIPGLNIEMTGPRERAIKLYNAEIGRVATDLARLMVTAYALLDVGIGNHNLLDQIHLCDARGTALIRMGASIAGGEGVRLIDAIPCDPVASGMRDALRPAWQTLKECRQEMSRISDEREVARLAAQEEKRWKTTRTTHSSLPQSAEHPMPLPPRPVWQSWKGTRDPLVGS